MRKVKESTLPSEQAFEFVQKFNQVVALDQEFARQLPSHEFELSFDKDGSIYIDGKPLGVNIKQRHRASQLRQPAPMTHRTQGTVTVKVTAWNNGKYSRTGSGYGLRIDPASRDAVFDGSWSHVVLDLPNGAAGVRVTLSPAFWRDCPELRSREIGRWLIAAGHDHWQPGRPPAFVLTRVSGNHFRVI